MWVLVQIVDGRPIVVETFADCSTNYEAMECYRDFCIEYQDRKYHVWNVSFAIGHARDISD